MLNKLSITAINLYQNHISPHKGYCCAHRAYTGEDSCSQYAKVAIAENGLFSAFPLIKEQFDKCSLAAEKMRKEREKKKKEKQDDATECLGDAACELIDPSCGCNIFDIFKRKKSHSSEYSSNHCDSCDCVDIGDCHPFH